MAILEILIYPDERLKRISEPVKQFDDELRTFIADLEQTMDAGPGGVGVAAPQTGRIQRIVIVDCSKVPKPVPNHGRLILVNPELTAWKGMEIGREGCMSVPDYTGNVIRATHITLLTQNMYGKSQEYHFEGFEARAVQHEIDHLDGMLFLDRLVSRRSDLFQRKVYQLGKTTA
ncbi:Peptide deformylase [Gammaproteobacteria bacterium]